MFTLPDFHYEGTFCCAGRKMDINPQCWTIGVVQRGLRGRAKPPKGSEIYLIGKCNENLKGKDGEESSGVARFRGASESEVEKRGEVDSRRDREIYPLVK